MIDALQRKCPPIGGHFRCYFSAAVFKSMAYLSNIGRKSGNLLLMAANNTPTNFSSMVKTVDPLSSCRSSNLRTPLKTKVSPLLHVIHRLAATSDTFGL